MPHLFGLILVGAATWAGYRWFQRELDRVQAVLRDADETLQQRSEKPIATLEQDPETGVYRPIGQTRR